MSAPAAPSLWLATRAPHPHVRSTVLSPYIIIMIIIINLIYIAQFDTSGILTALYIVITYIKMHYVHVRTYMK